jgi:hypothetical protein
VARRAEETEQLEPGVTRRERWIDLITVTLLAAASVLAAWSGYQSALWSGVQAASYSEAGARRVESVRASTTGYQLMQVDIALYLHWLNAFLTDNTELAAIIQERFSPRLAPAFDAWITTEPRTNPEAPSDPFHMPEYRVPELRNADELAAEANDLFNDGQEANQISDRYVASTVTLAIVLFFAGIAPRITWWPACMALLGVAMVMFLLGLFQSAILPVAEGLPIPGIST